MKTLATQLKKYHITEKSDLGKKNFAELLPSISLTPLGKGFFSRAFEIDGTQWVLKEGRFDLDIPTILGKKTIQGKSVEKMLHLFGYTFLPTREEAWRQYEEYLIFSRYFGYFDQTFSHYTDFENICAFQRGLRSNIGIFSDILKSKFGLNVPKNIAEICPLSNNFLPKEYMGFGTSFSPENRGKETSYIIQEFIHGKPLSKKSMKEYSGDELCQLYLLCILIHIYYLQTGNIPDTRPTSHPKHWGEWFMHTDNIYVTKDGGIKMIDTRWVWNVHKNIIKRGIIIPELIMKSVGKTAKKIEKMIF